MEDAEDKIKVQKITPVLTRTKPLVIPDIFVKKDTNVEKSRPQPIDIYERTQSLDHQSESSGLSRFSGSVGNLNTLNLPSPISKSVSYTNISDNELPGQETNIKKWDNECNLLENKELQSPVTDTNTTKPVIQELVLKEDLKPEDNPPDFRRRLTNLKPRPTSLIFEDKKFGVKDEEDNIFIKKLNEIKANRRSAHFSPGPRTIAFDFTGRSKSYQSLMASPIDIKKSIIKEENEYKDIMERIKKKTQHNEMEEEVKRGNKNIYEKLEEEKEVKMSSEDSLREEKASLNKEEYSEEVIKRENRNIYEKLGEEKEEKIKSLEDNLSEEQASLNKEENSQEVIKREYEELEEEKEEKRSLEHDLSEEKSSNREETSHEVKVEEENELKISLEDNLEEETTSSEVTKRELSHLKLSEDEEQSKFRNPLARSDLISSPTLKENWGSLVNELQTSLQLENLEEDKEMKANVSSEELDTLNPEKGYERPIPEPVLFSSGANDIDEQFSNRSYDTLKDNTTSDYNSSSDDLYVNKSVEKCEEKDSGENFYVNASPEVSRNDIPVPAPRTHKKSAPLEYENDELDSRSGF